MKHIYTYLIKQGENTQYTKNKNYMGLQKNLDEDSCLQYHLLLRAIKEVSHNYLWMKITLKTNLTQLWDLFGYSTYLSRRLFF